SPHVSPSRRRSLHGLWPLSSLQHDLHDIGDFLVTLVLGFDADDPAGLDLGEGNGLLDKSSLPWLGRAREPDDLRSRWRSRRFRSWSSCLAARIEGEA